MGIYGISWWCNGIYDGFIAFDIWCDLIGLPSQFGYGTRWWTMFDHMSHGLGWLGVVGGIAPAKRKNKQT